MYIALNKKTIANTKKNYIEELQFWENGVVEILKINKLILHFFSKMFLSFSKEEKNRFITKGKMK